jgi:hypothetical protein
MEGCTSSTSRHYTASSVDQIAVWIKNKEFNSVLQFVLDSILNILRTKLKAVKEVGEALAKSSNDMVMLELCTINKVISYPDFMQFTAILNTLDRVSEPKLELTRNMTNCQADPEFMSKYIPQYKGGL